MPSLNSQPDQNGTLPAEKLFGLKWKTTLPSLTVPSIQSVPTQKHTVNLNLRRKLP